jgi:hypothetical protein
MKVVLDCTFVFIVLKMSESLFLIQHYLNMFGGTEMWLHLFWYSSHDRGE